MKRAAALLLAALGVTGAACAQASPEELAILGNTEQWTYWMMVTGVVSSASASLGVIALIWTFRAQRSMTHSQERAVIEFGALSASYYEDLRAVICRLEVTNTGRTHAGEISLRCEFYDAVTWLRVVLDQDDRLRSVRERKKMLRRAKPVAVGVSEDFLSLAPGKRGTLVFHIHDVQQSIVDELLGQGGVKVYGFVYFRDIYGVRRETQIDTQVVGLSERTVSND